MSIGVGEAGFDDDVILGRARRGVLFTLSSAVGGAGRCKVGDGLVGTVGATGC